MNTPVSKSSENTNWRELYRDAILELDPSKLSVHIAEAEKALIHRGRELVQEGGDNRKEEQALGDAMYFLRALRSVEVQADSTCPQLGSLNRVKAA